VKWIIIILLFIYPVKAINTSIINPDFRLDDKTKIKLLLYQEVNRSGLSYEDFKKLRALAFYESSFREVYGDNGRAWGIFQYHKKTFDWLSRKYKVKLNYKSTLDQIKLTILAYKDNRMDLWAGWRVAKLRNFKY